MASWVTAPRPAGMRRYGWAPTPTGRRSRLGPTTRRRSRPTGRCGRGATTGQASWATAPLPSVGAHPYRRIPVGGGAVTQLAIAVVAPGKQGAVGPDRHLSLIHISEPTRLGMIS